MTDGNTLIVDVVSSGDGYMLNDTPVNMMIAYEVVRRHVTDNGTFYSQMTMKQKTAEGYVFKFDTGDVFESASDTAYPTAESVSDSTDKLPSITDADDGKVLTADSGVWVAQTPASGGGVLVVTDTDGTLDKTWQEIHDAMLAGVVVVTRSAPLQRATIVVDTTADTQHTWYIVYIAEGEAYGVSSASGYPSYME